MRRFIATALALLAMAAVSGCTSRTTPRPPDASLRQLSRLDVFRGDLTQPMMGERAGLEMLWWLTPDDDYQVARALSAYELTPRTVDAQLAPALQAWRDSGLRLARLPLNQHQQLMQALPVRRLRQHVWFGQAPLWRELVAGRQIAPGQQLQIDGRQVELEGGVLRMLARAWVAPAPAGPVLRLDLVPQLQHEEDVTLRGLAQAAGAPSILALDAGTLFDLPPLHLALAEGEALLLTAAAPAADWSNPPPPESEQLAEADAEEQATSPDQPAPVDPGELEWGELTFTGGQKPFGPPARPAPSLGEAMLAAGREQAAVPMKVVVLLTARLPERFSLLRAADKSSK